MRVRSRCEGCGRRATVAKPRADLLYYCERCAVEYADMSLADVRRHFGESRTIATHGEDE